MSTRPLVVRFGALGDMVMITPLLRILAARCGEPVDVLGSGKWCHDIFAHLPWVADVEVLSGRKTPYYLSSEQRALVKKLKQRGPGPVWFLEDMPKAWRLMQRAGIHRDHCVRMDDFKRGVDEHTVRHWIRLAQLNPQRYALPLLQDESLAAENCELMISAEETSNCAVWLQSLNCADAPLVLIQAGSKKTMKGGKPDRESNLKYWPPEHWAQVIQHVLSVQPRAHVLICGAPSEQALAIDIAALVKNDRVHAVADQLPLRRLVALMKRAHSCISVDTGPAHIAAAVNCPLVVLFGQTNPRLYQPMTSESIVSIVSQTPVDRVAPGSTAWAACNSMANINPEQVQQAWDQLCQQG